MTDLKETYRLVRGPIRKLARQGRLVDEAYKTFQRMAYPGAPPDQVAAMRVAFFAGGQELLAILTASVDEEDDITEGDMEFMQHVATELETFHERTIRASEAQGRPT